MCRVQTLEKAEGNGLEQTLMLIHSFNENSLSATMNEARTLPSCGLGSNGEAGGAQGGCVAGDDTCHEGTTRNAGPGRQRRGQWSCQGYL